MCWLGADPMTDDMSTTAPASVLLIHGIWNARAWMTPFAARLRVHGLTPTTFGYDSVLGTTERAVERLVAQLRRRPVAYAVGYSLGGLVLLEALRLAPDLAVERAVCMGSPLQGSAAARGLSGMPGGAWLMGGSADILRRGAAAWEGRTQVGCIAGDRARGLGRVFARFEEPSDGTVAVAETRLPGLADHCIVPASHSGLILSAAAAAQAARFLREGRFGA